MTRNQYGSDAMVQELAGSQDVFATPLLETTRKLSQVHLCVCMCFE